MGAAGGRWRAKEVEAHVLWHRSQWAASQRMHLVDAVWQISRLMSVLSLIWILSCVPGFRPAGPHARCPVL